MKLGIDAQVALEFHEKREAHPEKFKNRTLNKIKYEYSKECSNKQLHCYWSTSYVWRQTSLQVHRSRR